MKIIHTADWHLGQRLQDFDRLAEHQLFLDWLLNVLKKESIDALLVAGDVFDTNHPPNAALAQYYNFLVNASQYCANLIIVGGNHDSPATLNAPHHLLKRLNIHVIGKACEDISQQIIPIKRGEKIVGVIAAVPFLRQRDIRRTTAGETYTEKVERIKQGIKNHYQALADLVAPYKAEGLPVVATGHLTAVGSGVTKEDISDSERAIYIGNQGNVGADVFPALFDYVALGHIHKPKLVDVNRPHIRYAGAPIPLSISEIKDKKQIVIVDWLYKTMNIICKPIPSFRKLLLLKGDLNTVLAAMQNFEEHSEVRPTLVEVRLELEKEEPSLHEQIKLVASQNELAVLRTKVQYKLHPTDLATQLEQQISLDDLTPLEVFLKKCENVNEAADEESDLVLTFKDLQVWMKEQGEEKVGKVGKL